MLFWNMNRAVSEKKRGNFDYVSACRGGGARMPIQRKILRWKQYEGDVSGGGNAKKGVDVLDEVKG